jgi:outer membrane protein assembly factor BamB
LATTVPLQAADWREFRGPDGTGHYQGAALPKAWGPDSAGVLWKAEVPGLGWSSPILVKGKLILTTAVPNAKTYSLRVLAFDSSTGQELWNKELFVEDTTTVPQPHKKNSHASPTPVSDGERVWVHFGHMGSACLTLNGDIQWKNDELKYKPVHGNGASPILVDNTLVFAMDGADVQAVVALNKDTGKVAWKTDRKMGSKMPFSFATAQLAEHEGKKVLISPASDWAAGYDPKDGKELWRVKYPVNGWSLICRPVVGHGMAFISTGYMTQHIIAVPLGGTGDITGKIAWQTRKNAPNTPTPILVGNELYVVSDSGILTCFDAKTGTVHWSERLKGKSYSASPICVNGKELYFTSEEGVGQVIAAKKEGFDELGKGDMREKTFATFVPDNGAMYIRTESKLFKVK